MRSSGAFALVYLSVRPTIRHLMMDCGFTENDSSGVMFIITSNI